MQLFLKIYPLENLVHSKSLVVYMDIVMAHVKFLTQFIALMEIYRFLRLAMSIIFYFPIEENIITNIYYAA